MLPDVGFSELLVLAIVVLVFVKPEDVPLVMHKLGIWTAQLQAYVRGMGMGWQEQADRVMAERAPELEAKKPQKKAKC